MTSSSNRYFSWPVAALLLGATLWGIVWYPMRLLEKAGLGGLWLTLIIYLAALVISLPYTWRHFREILDAPAILVPIALASGWTNVAFVLAVLDGNILRVLLLFYLSPLWAVMLAWFVLAERPSRLAWITIGVAVTGALMMLWNPSLGLPWPTTDADWLAITSGMAFAVSNVFVRKGQNVSLAAKVGVTWAGVVIMALVLIMIFTQTLSATVDYRVFIAAIGLGIGGILLMTVLVQYGVTRVPVYRSAVILLFELVAGAVSQQLLTAEVMTALEWCGGGLIVAAAYLSARS